MKQKIKISKLDAAKRQLETAIRLFFSECEPVSIHTLASAAYGIIRDINKKMCGEPMLAKDKIMEYIKPECQKEVSKKINEAQNFFKHADRDHDEGLDFNPNQCELFIVDACSKYAQISGEWPPLFRIMQIWFMAKNIKYYNLPKEQMDFLSKGNPSILTIGKSQFYSEILPIVMKIKT